MTVFNHAIVGCGRVAANHVDGFRMVPGWSVVAACDRESHVAEFARSHAIPRAVRDAGELFEDAEITSVTISVDHQQHARLAEGALLSGKHVLVEKPLCLDPKQGRSLVELAERKRLVLSVVSQHRYDPVVLAVRQWIRNGLLGDLVQVHVSLQANRPPEYYTSSYWRGKRAGEGGSALMNQGYHCLDVVRWLCGELAAVAAVSQAIALAPVIETEDTLSGLLMAAGTPVLLSVTVASSTQWRTRIEVVGRSGSVIFDLDHPGRLHHWTGSAELVALAEEESARNLAEEPPGVSYYGISHRRQIADFCRSIASGAPMLSSAADALGTLETIKDLYELAGDR